MSNITVRQGTQIVSLNGHCESGIQGKGQALVLSAGGLFAAYQAGVYKALWPHWKPDLVVGASAGALNALADRGAHPSGRADRTVASSGRRRRS